MKTRLWKCSLWAGFSPSIETVGSGAELGSPAATGAFLSSPKVSLEAEANVMPSSLRREFMCSNYVRIFKPHLSALSFLQDAIFGWPFAEVVLTVFDKLHFPLPGSFLLA